MIAARHHESGDAAKQAALGQHLSGRGGPYIRAAQRVLLERLLTGAERVTIDDVRDAVPLPAGLSPKLFGAVPGALVKFGLIEKAGYAQTARPEAHARPVTLWRLRAGADTRTAARAWLAANPRPDLGEDY